MGERVSGCRRRWPSPGLRGTDGAAGPGTVAVVAGGPGPKEQPAEPPAREAGPQSRRLRAVTCRAQPGPRPGSPSGSLGAHASPPELTRHRSRAQRPTGTGQTRLPSRHLGKWHVVIDGKVRLPGGYIISLGTHGWRAEERGPTPGPQRPCTCPFPGEPRQGLRRAWHMKTVPGISAAGGPGASGCGTERQTEGDGRWGGPLAGEGRRHLCSEGRDLTPTGAAGRWAAARPPLSRLLTQQPYDRPLTETPH